MKNKLNFLSAINKMSYGYTSFNILKELRKSLDIAFFPISNNIEIDDNSNAPWINEILHNGMSTGGYKDAPAIRLWHQFDLHMFPFCSRKIGFPIFELDDFTEQERAHIEGCDDIIVCSKWAKNIVEEKTKQKNIYVVPLGYDPEVFKHTNKTKDNICRFLIVGKKEIRKLSDLLPEIFDRTFDIEDNIEIHVCWDNVFNSKEEEKKWDNLLLNSKLGSKYRFIRRVNSAKDMADIYNKADVLFSPSRAEGFMLPIVEGKACGLQVIACNYSGVTEHLSPKDHLINIDDFEIAEDFKFFRNNIGRWAKFEEPQIKQSSDHLRFLYEEKMKGEDIINYDGIKQVQNFTWANSALKINDILYK